MRTFQTGKVLTPGAASSRRGRGAAAALLASALAAVGVLPAGPAQAAPRQVARWSFDSAAAPMTYRDSTGNGHTLRPLTRHGGRAVPVLHAPGRALLFPWPCAGAGVECPKAALTTAGTADLNPGTAAIRYSALVKLPLYRRGTPQVVLTKGYGNAGGSYKMQLDPRGIPGCILFRTGTGEVYGAGAGPTVADSVWHRIECLRDRTALVLLVDGVQRQRSPIPRALSVANAAPLVVGARNTHDRNDQFNGYLDDVRITIG
ncbi:hypothetical protein GCM10010124_17320 [Pilimelia terevasa]|uniref:Concanavalin A-like lectin/glucanase superfamily protein n=1 Tax=Pilimelia terevasa TaxID=53372 RepID=A0A8J3BSR7_9ACTN|nr:LamG domain-containing protein [Pilimelia terevasa]GGK25309.1 hypothetical protein GCM10010124_17320 [Pilimelia terevasa]